MCIVIIFIRTFPDVYRLYSCGPQEILLVQSNEIACSLPALYGDGTVKGSGCLLPVRLYCKMTDIDRQTVARSTISNFSVLLRIYDILMDKIWRKSPVLI
jgi:hypothetical protein